MGPKCVPQLFLKSLLGTLLAILFLSLVTVSEVFTKTNSAPSLRTLQAILPKILCAPDVALLRKRVSRWLMRDTRYSGKNGEILSKMWNSLLLLTAIEPSEVWHLHTEPRFQSLSGEFGSKPSPLTRMARTGLGTRLLHTHLYNEASFQKQLDYLECVQSMKLPLRSQIVSKTQVPCHQQS